MSDIHVSWVKRTSGVSRLILKFVGVTLSSLMPQGFSVLSLILLSNFCVWLVLFLTINSDYFGQTTFAIIPALLTIHLFSGYLSRFVSGGQQSAKKVIITAFLDHYLIALNIEVLIYTVFCAYEIQQTLLLSLLLVSAYLSSVAIYYKQFKTGELYFSSFGYTEGVVLTIILLSVSNISIVKKVLTNGNAAGMPFHEISILLLSVVILVTFIMILKGIPNMRYSIWMFAILFSLTGAISSQLFSWEGVIAILTLYGCLYIGKILTGHFIDGIERSPGLFTPLFVLIIFLLPGLFDMNTLLIIVIYLAANNILQIYRFITTVKKLNI